MKAIPLVHALILSVATALFATQAAASGMPRLVQPLDDNWRFHLGADTNAIAPDYNDREWRVVDVPHDYVVEGNFERTNRFPQADSRGGWFWLHGFLPVQPAV